MVHIVPRIIRGSHGFHDVFIRMEDGGWEQDFLHNVVVVPGASS